MGQQKVFENETAFTAAKRATTSSTGHLLIRNKFFGLDPHQFVLGATGRTLEWRCAGHRHVNALLPQMLGACQAHQNWQLLPRRAYSRPQIGKYNLKQK
jgi:hypothetical protein